MPNNRPVEDRRSLEVNRFARPLCRLALPLTLAACSSAASAVPDAAAPEMDDAAAARDAGTRDARRTADGAKDAGRSDAAGLDDARHDRSPSDSAGPDAFASEDAGTTNDAGGACATGLPSPTTAPSTVDTTCFVSTFDDEFDAYDISSGPIDDGLHPNERWFNGTDQCCMSPSNGEPGVMYPTPGATSGAPVNPYSLIPGGGLQISLQEKDNEWFSGVMTSVDKNGDGFAQAYGYFEMKAQLAPGTGTWPSFWMLSLPMGVSGGEIDVFEQLGCSPPLNPAVESIFHFTLHDWAGGTTPAAYTATVTPDLTAGQHRYGLLWNASYMALYFDGQLLYSTPTPAVMLEKKYYLLADMGIGWGWITTSTPNPSNLMIDHIRAYSVPGF